MKKRNIEKSSNEILSLSEAADLTCLKESRIRYEIFRGQIPHLKIGRSVRFQKTDLMDWLNSKKRGEAK